MPSTITAGTTSGTSLNFSGDTSGVLTVQGVTMGNGGVGNGNATRFKNRIINGDMRIDQRNAGASFTPTTSVNYGTCDRWSIDVAQNSKLTAQQNAGAVTPPAGFINYLGITSSSAYSVAASDFFMVRQGIEGLNIADLGFGTANAKTITLSFWVRSSLTGTFGGALRNSAGNRSYPFTYTISAANTWEQKSVTIAGDTSGTWLTTNGIGINLNFSVGAGATFSGTAGAWAAANLVSATGATSVIGTNGATFYVTGVQLEVGSSATGFEYVDYTTQLSMCQRYYFKLGGQAYNTYAIGAGEGVNVTFNIAYPVQMRSAPTLGLSGTNRIIPAGSLSNNTIAYSQLGNSGGYFGVNVSSVTNGLAYLLGANNDTSASFFGNSEL
jgi:hypothetical protein